MTKQHQQLYRLREADLRAEAVNLALAAHNQACPDCVRPLATDEPIAGRCWRRDMLVALLYTINCEQDELGSELLASGVLV